MISLEQIKTELKELYNKNKTIQNDLKIEDFYIQKLTFLSMVGKEESDEYKKVLKHLKMSKAESHIVEACDLEDKYIEALTMFDSNRSSTYKDIAQLRFLKGLSYKEIAEILFMQENVVYVRVSEIYVKVYEYLNENN